jgi:formylglycine-generating enzyme required for sulfatase activity
VANIFLSYRREDGGWAGRLAGDLRREFSEGEVFQDIASIEIGEDFIDATRRSLARCAVALVLIGPQWLRAKRRLDDPDDWVRLEIIESLQRPGLRVVPVLVGAARMPKTAELPEPLKGLARRHAHEITDKRWEYDVSQLVAALKDGLGITGSSRVPGAGRAVPLDDQQRLPRDKPAPDHAPQIPVRAGYAAPLPRVSLEVLAGGKWARTPRSASALLPRTVFRDGAWAPEMVIVPAGVFLMGSPDTERGHARGEEPLHEVRISQAFAVGRTAVTFEQWDACIRAGCCSHRPGDDAWGRDQRPVINVSWEDAQTYLAWLSDTTGTQYRLLTEAEWEYSARAGTSTCYPWGDQPGQNLANFEGSSSRWSGKQTAPVGSFEPNDFGLFDMIGNVWEWVQDCFHGDYTGAPTDGSAWEDKDGSLRVMRGGSWNTASPRCAHRHGGRSDSRYQNLGFRVARMLAGG